MKIVLLSSLIGQQMITYQYILIIIEYRQTLLWSFHRLMEKGHHKNEKKKKRQDDLGRRRETQRYRKRRSREWRPFPSYMRLKKKSNRQIIQTYIILMALVCWCFD